ncbi:MAG: hypothetical protein ACTHUY_02490 [Flaviflexus sp.]|uniref:hypothetical protein n=1 Tax=Flaviflexus sp. TaxID=1969482 RepID=UPI003F9077B5
MSEKETMRLLRDTNRALGRFLGSPTGRATLRHNGYDSSRRIVPMLESESLDILFRNLRVNGAAVVAVYYPKRAEDERFEFLEFGDLELDLSGDTSEDDSVVVGRDRNGELSTVGMLCDSIRRNFEVRFTQPTISRNDSLELPFEEPRVYSMVS